jgi:hypothetical protein
MKANRRLLKTLNFSYTLTRLCGLRSRRDVAALRNTAGLASRLATKE